MIYLMKPWTRKGSLFSSGRSVLLAHCDQVLRLSLGSSVCLNLVLLLEYTVWVTSLTTPSLMPHDTGLQAVPPVTAVLSLKAVAVAVATVAVVQQLCSSWKDSFAYFPNFHTSTFIFICLFFNTICCTQAQTSTIILIM